MTELRTSDHVGSQIRIARQIMGWSMAELAERCPGLSEDVIQHIETGRPAAGHRTRAITVDELMVIVNALGFSLVHLTATDVNFGGRSPEAQERMIAAAEGFIEQSRELLARAERDQEKAREEVRRMRETLKKHEENLWELRNGDS